MKMFHLDVKFEPQNFNEQLIGSELCSFVKQVSYHPI